MNVNLLMDSVKNVDSNSIEAMILQFVNVNKDISKKRDCVCNVLHPVNYVVEMLINVPNVM